MPFITNNYEEVGKQVGSKLYVNRHIRSYAAGGRNIVISTAVAGQIPRNENLYIDHCYGAASNATAEVLCSLDGPRESLQ